MPTDFGGNKTDGTILTAGMLNQYQDAIQGLEKGPPSYAVDSGPADAYLVAPSPPAPDPLVAGYGLRVKMAHAPTGAGTLDVGTSDGAIAVKKNGSEALEVGDWEAGQVVGLTFDGTSWQLDSPGVPSTAADLNAAGGYRQSVDGWYQDDVAASQAAVALSRAAAGALPTKWIAPRDGSITGLWVKSNEARTAGTLTVDVYLDGVATGLQAVLDGTSTTFTAPTQAKDVDAFTAGQELDIRITTDGSWAPTTADIRAGLEVET